MDKHEIAAIFEEIATLLTIKGENPFKVRAYIYAARALESLDEDVEVLIKTKRLKDVPHIGEHLTKKITALATKGRLPFYEKLKKSVPEGILELLKVPGLGGKRIKVLLEKLKIKNIKDLTEACQSGKIAKLGGFGIKSQNNILSGIDKMNSYEKRFLHWEVQEIANELIEKISHIKTVKKVEMAGSFRRQLETVGDLDIVASSKQPASVINAFVKLPFIKKVLLKGPTKTTVLLKKNIRVDLRVVLEEQFSFALIYFIGSKEHNIALRQRANKLGFTLSEYSLDPIKPKTKSPFKKKSIPSENDVYKVLKLRYIPIELRENMGEIEAAEKGKLPKLVEESDIKGDFHCHTASSDGHNTLNEMVEKAEKLNWQYLGISDHSKSSFQAHGLHEECLLEQIDQIKKLNRSKKYTPFVFAGIECDVLKNGKLDFSNAILKELDYVIISIHSSLNLDEKSMTERLIRAIENPYSTIVGHLTGRLLLKRDPIKLNVTKVIDACIASNKIIELNSQPLRLDMDWRFWHKAKEKGLKCMINTDAHNVDELDFYKAGVSVAKKGWLEKKDILNTLSLEEIKKYLNFRK
jgi:DNA polymerase (family X)